MDLKTWKERQASGNPIYPYHWVAKYVDGTTISQFDGLRSRTSFDIDRQHVNELVIMRHPMSPIVVERPTGMGVPDRIIVRASVDMVTELGTPGFGPNAWKYKVAYFIGYRYGTHEFLLQIDDDGRLRKAKTGF